MKKILLFILLICSIQTIKGQGIDINSYLQIQDSIYQHLNKSRISSGTLYDRVYQWANLPTYSSEDTITYSYVKQAWYELFLSSYNQKRLTSINEAQEISIQNELDGKGISIGYIDFQYNVIDSNAFANGSLVLGNDSLLYDGEGETSPYLEQQITLPIIFADKVMGESVKFYLDPALVLKNGTGRNLTQLILETSNGGSILLTPGESQELSIQGIMDSLMVIGLQMNFDYGPSEFGHLFLGNVNVIPMHSETANKCVSIDSLPIWSGNNLKFQGYDETFPSQGFGQYKIYYHLQDLAGTNCDKRLRKPIIIMDGFDPKNEARPTPDKIWELLSYGNKHLGDSLRLKGYDVIVLNFPNYNTIETSVIRDGGADYIERNAMVLIKLIQQVNDSLQHNNSFEQLVVIGPSMGGQIARYALAYMEKQQSLSIPKMNHNTRLYVSFDSPHLGANISIGLQQALYFLGYKANQLKALNNYEDQLLSKAGRQMLIEQLDGLNKNSPYFQTYYNTSLINNGLPNSQGWPVNLRKVALINGNAAGIGTNVAGQQLLSGEARTTASIKGLELDLHAMPNYNQQIETFSGIVRESKNFTGAFGLSYSFTFPFSNYLTPNLKQELFFSQTIMGLYWSKLIKTYKGWYTTKNLNTNGSMDIVPGGTFDAIDFFKKEIDETLNGEGKKIKNRTWFKNEKRHSFIPSISALAFKNPNFNWSTRFDDRNLVCNNEIPFDNYFTAKTNEEHVHVSEAAANWIMEEIQYGQQGCPVVCATDITGPSLVCPNQNYTYTIIGTYPPNTIVNWNIPSGYQIQNQTANSITVKSNNYGGMVEVVLSPTLNGQKCSGSVRFSKSITNEFYNTITISPGATQDYFIATVQPEVSFPNVEWSTDGGGTFLSGSNPQTFSYDETSGILFARVTTSCGVKTIHKLIPQQISATIKEGETTVSPNPSAKNWTIRMASFKTQNNHFSLWNSTGIKVWEKVTKEKVFDILNEHLASGLYLLKIQSKDGSETLKLIKN